MHPATLLVSTSETLVNLALLLIRVFIGVCFVIHGLGKLGLVGTGNMEGFAAWLEELGVPMAQVQARIAMLSEITGGTLLALGLFARPGCLLLIGTIQGSAFRKILSLLRQDRLPGALARRYPCGFALLLRNLWHSAFVFFRLSQQLIYRLS